MDIDHVYGVHTLPRCVSSIFLAFLIFISFDCFNEPLEPVAPSWDVNLTVPLANRFYTLSEIVQKDTSMLRVGVGQQIIYSTTVSTSPLADSNFISINPKDTTLHIKFGVFRVVSPPIVRPIQLPWVPQGVSVPIPDTSFSVADLTDSIPTFQSVTFESGTMSLSIQNNLPVPIDIISPIHMVDAQGNVIGTFIYTPSTIGPNSSGVASDDLAGKSVGNQIRISGIALHTQGSPNPVPIPLGDLLVATLSTSNLKARQAVFAEIPAQRLSDNDTARYALDDSTIIKEVKIKSGTLNFAFSNRVDLNMVFKFRLNEFQRPVGSAYVPYEDSVFIAAQGSGTISLNLAGYKIESMDGNLIHSVEVVSSVILPSSSGAPVTVSDTDKVFIAVSHSFPIIADTAVCVLKPTWVNVNTAIGVHFGDLPSQFFGQLSIPSAALGFGTRSSFGFPTDLYISISAKKNAAGDSAYLQVPLSQKRLQPGVDSVIFDPQEVGQFLSQFSGRLPDSLRISGKVLVNPPDVYSPTLAGVGSVGRHSSFSGNIHLDVPLRLGLVDGAYSDTLVVGDTTGDGHKDFDLHKSTIDNLNSGKFFIQVENGIPMQIGVLTRLLGHTQQTLLLVPQSGQPILATAATVDGNGNVTLPARSAATFELNQQEVRQFNPAELLTYFVTLQTTPGSPAVSFKTTDYIRIRIWSQLSTRVNQ